MLCIICKWLQVVVLSHVDFQLKHFRECINSVSLTLKEAKMLIPPLVPITCNSILTHLPCEPDIISGGLDPGLVSQCIFSSELLLKSFSVKDVRYLPMRN